MPVPTTWNDCGMNWEDLRLAPYDPYYVAIAEALKERAIAVGIEDNLPEMIKTPNPLYKILEYMSAIWVAYEMLCPYFVYTEGLNRGAVIRPSVPSENHTSRYFLREMYDAVNELKQRHDGTLKPIRGRLISRDFTTTDKAVEFLSSLRGGENNDMYIYYDELWVEETGETIERRFSINVWLPEGGNHYFYMWIAPYKNESGVSLRFKAVKYEPVWSREHSGGFYIGGIQSVNIGSSAIEHVAWAECGEYTELLGSYCLTPKEGGLVTPTNYTDEDIPDARFEPNGSTWEEPLIDLFSERYPKLQDEGSVGLLYKNAVLIWDDDVCDFSFSKDEAVFEDDDWIEVFD